MHRFRTPIAVNTLYIYKKPSRSENEPGEQKKIARVHAKGLGKNQDRLKKVYEHLNVRTNASGKGIGKKFVKTL